MIIMMRTSTPDDLWDGIPIGKPRRPQGHHRFQFVMDSASAIGLFSSTYFRRVWLR